jgi:hypothetical protein
MGPENFLASPGPDLTLECSLLPVLDLTEAEWLKTCSCTDSSLVLPSAGTFTFSSLVEMCGLSRLSILSLPLH